MSFGYLLLKGFEGRKEADRGREKKPMDDGKEGLARGADTLF